MAARAPSAGWVDHDGSGCPVPPAARVQVMFRSDRDRFSAERLSGADGNVADAYDTWTWAGQGEQSHDIIALREVHA